MTSSARAANIISLVPTRKASEFACKTIVKMNDPNFIATVHSYGFWPFSVNIAGFTKFE